MAVAFAGGGTYRAFLNSAPAGMETEASIIGFVFALIVLLIAMLLASIFGGRS